jgi:transposase
MNKDNMKYAGIDIGDKTSLVQIIDSEGEFLKEVRIPTTRKALAREFDEISPMHIALEVGGHSRWMSQALKRYGHSVTVANPSKVRLVYKNPRKSDRIDAQYLVKLLRFEPTLLEPIEHRSNASQKDLALLRSRDSLVRARTSLINQTRGIVKSFGERLPSSKTDAFAQKVREYIPFDLKPALDPILDTIQTLSEQIKAFDKEIERLCQEAYPETEKMRQIKGVGPITALAYVLTIEDPHRFHKSREVGAYLGMVPKRSQSGDVDPEKRITKTGDKYLRRLLIGSAQYILGPFGPETKLRNWGLRLAERGGKRAKHKATVAVARKLAVLLHKLWVSGEDYHPFYPERKGSEANTD